MVNQDPSNNNECRFPNRITTLCTLCYTLYCSDKTASYVNQQKAKALRNKRDYCKKKYGSPVKTFIINWALVPAVPRHTLVIYYPHLRLHLSERRLLSTAGAPWN